MVQERPSGPSRGEKPEEPQQIPLRADVAEVLVGVIETAKKADLFEGLIDKEN